MACSTQIYLVHYLVVSLVLVGNLYHGGGREHISLGEEGIYLIRGRKFISVLKGVVYFSGLGRREFNFSRWRRGKVYLNGKKGICYIDGLGSIIQ